MDLCGIFGENVFSDKVQRQTLPHDVYDKLRATIEAGKTLDISIAGTVASAMKKWATDRGATHYTHWFQPLTGLTAEKHECFLEKSGEGAIAHLSGKSLIVGESDASSFPSGGSRATYMARGYTAWDPTSPAFVKDNTLYIPTVFVSHTGETLDNKAPLLRSMTALDKQAKRLMKLFNMECRKVFCNLGIEQEYFLVDEKVYSARKDLQLTGRTLFGANVTRGQELEDNYYGAIKPRVAAFMREVDEELWKLGIMSKTEHNEVAPAQHEMASVYGVVNCAVDENMLTMEIMKNVAKKHGMRCLLHEKPFRGINGSGKHNNWSLSTDTGFNLLEPGPSPEKNTFFKLVLTAVIKAVDDYQGILRASVASAGNDHRLGADEAPPAIMSVYLGDQLGAMVDCIVKGENYVAPKSSESSIGVPESPIFPKNATDRNRTSPFAFTGNKFEFRSPGSSMNAAEANICLNTIVADAFAQFADELESKKNIEKSADALISRELKKHYRIIYNLDGYGPEWEAEAKKRKLLNNKTCADAAATMYEEKNIRVYVRQKVFTRQEAIARADIKLENYTKTINIEALTMVEMARRDIIPAVSAFLGELCSTLEKKTAVGCTHSAVESTLIEKLSSLNDKAAQLTDKLEGELNESSEGSIASANKMAHVIIPDMENLRKTVDEMEKSTYVKFWNMPTYFDILYSVK